MSEHIGLNKLKGFEPVYVINLESRKDRYEYITKTLKDNHVKNYQIVVGIDGSIVDLNSMVFARDKVELTDNEMGATLAHLKAIKQWLETSDSEYAIIIEDDLSFETLQKWNFNFDDFIKSIKKPYDMLQLCLIHNFTINTTLHIRELGDWSAACYLIKRKRAEDLIDKYFINNQYVLPTKHYFACPESVVFLGAKVLSVPLFTYNNEFESSIPADYHWPLTKNEVLQKSRNEALDYWENNDFVRMFQ
jgi:GR25 family glycosyltransferase involved in LPS biosynthesis